MRGFRWYRFIRRWGAGGNSEIDQREPSMHGISDSLIFMRSFAATLVVFSGLGFAQTKLTSVEGITQYRLDNGMDVLLFADKSKPTVTVNVTYMVGSRHEGY